jgi:hypothetical protein
MIGRRRTRAPGSGRLLIAVLAVLVLAGYAAHRGGARDNVSPPAGHDVSVALRQLATLRVLPARPHRPGYTRDRFGPAWTDDTSAPGGHDGCDTRDDVLRAQLSAVHFRPGSRCVVLAGELRDPYTARTIHFTKQQAGAVQIDHLVPLALAWDLGANTWPPARQAMFANDERVVLLAVAGPANEAKADHGPAEWMPPNPAYRASYAARFVAVLAAYHLPVTAADKSALTAALRSSR